MNEPSLQSVDVIRLMTWFTPAFPIGAFSYSQALESAVALALVDDAESLASWLATLLAHGTLWNEGVLLAEAYRLTLEAQSLDALHALALALCGSKERQDETTAQAQAFRLALAEWQDIALGPVSTEFCLPVLAGGAVALARLPLDAALCAYYHSAIANQIQVALRLMPLGQQAGLRILRHLEAPLFTAASRAAHSSLDDLGSATIKADIAALHHETLQPRIFRS